MPHWVHLPSIVIDQRTQQHDRTAAIVVGAALEHTLRVCILDRMVHLTPSQENELFQSDRAPLSTLDSRITAGFTLGLFGTKTRKELDLLRRIRNAFAHSIEDLTFETEAIKVACNHLVFSHREISKRSYPPEIYEELVEVLSGPKDRYIYSTYYIVNELTRPIHRTNSPRTESLVASKKPISTDLD
jgi:hypothetical protein